MHLQLPVNEDLDIIMVHGSFRGFLRKEGRGLDETELIQLLQGLLTRLGYMRQLGIPWERLL